MGETNIPFKPQIKLVEGDDEGTCTSNIVEEQGKDPYIAQTLRLVELY